ncbi:MAG TPA: flagellar hook capping FlgD N-terminal domain-containing protein [bacterium]|nr:flagellar hook capping FlgD N-terminal domain-containing protein [bacterium]
MDVNSVGTNQTTQQSASTVATTAANLGTDQFLKLLTVQLQHQDPLSPLQNEEMLAQLAQFSSLEQLQNMNTNLKSNLNLNLMLTQILSNTAAAALVGKTVVASGKEITLDSSNSAAVRFDLSAAAQRVEVTIKDQSGATVRTIEADGLAAGRNELAWDGKDANGESVAAGTYQVAIKAYDASGNEVTATPLTTGEVTSVRYKDGQAYLVIDGEEVSISDVLEITS